jgi:hypothetical protein
VGLSYVERPLGASGALYWLSDYAGAHFTDPNPRLARLLRTVQDGFIHMTKEPKLLLTVANHFYTDVKGEYVVLAVDSTKLTSPVKFEPAADVGNKKSDGLVQGNAEPVLFPHLVRGSISPRGSVISV